MFRITNSDVSDMSDTTHVVSVGTEDLVHAAYSVFLERHRCAVAVVKNHCHLTRLPVGQACDIAVLQATLSLYELEETARVIRQRWPRARILILREEARGMEDALYDERARAGINPEILLGVIERIHSGAEVNSTRPRGTVPALG